MLKDPAKSFLTKTKHKIKSLRKKLKKLRFKLPKFTKVKLLATSLLLALAGFSILTLFVAKVPDMHDLYLRETVGSKTYIIKADLSGGGGTGFQLKAPSGTDYIVTNSHVCNFIQKLDDENNKQTVLVLSDDGSWVRRRIVAVSDRSDLCLVEGMPNVSGLSLGSEPYVGEHMYVVGHPHLRPNTLSAGEVIGSQDVKIMDHIIEVKGNPFVAMMLPPADPGDKCDLPKNEIQVIPLPDMIGGGELSVCFDNTLGAYMTSIIIYPGNSGSPMVDFWGHVCGVAFASDSRDNFGDVVSLKDLQAFVAKY